ncbi:DNA excision repair protein ERCC-6-like, partial [Cichlidogyrus casuarinus]
RQATKAISGVQRFGGCLITTYGLLTTNRTLLMHRLDKCPDLMHATKVPDADATYGPQFMWTAIVLDEGHKIKNPATKCCKAALLIPATFKMILTGTAVQNRLDDLWSLYNFTHRGKLLGTMATFKREFASHIQRGREKDATSSEIHYGNLVAESLRKRIEPVFLRRTKKEILGSEDKLLRESNKLAFMANLLEHFQTEESENGHKTLVFSQSLVLLNMAEQVIKALNRRPDRPENAREHRVLRMHGSLKLQERAEVMQLFQTDPSYNIMLLTTQVGGVGLTLTAANRVIILDPSWNPSTDSQAIDRAYRIGQQRPVLVYRLITCSTIEEKIYRRQVFKDSVIRKTTGSKVESVDSYRYFTNAELRELFKLDDLKDSQTQRQLEKLHWDLNKRNPQPVEVEEHLSSLEANPRTKRAIFGFSRHDLMFSVKDQHEGVASGSDEHVYATQKLQQAEEQITRETSGEKVRMPPPVEPFRPSQMPRKVGPTTQLLYTHFANRFTPQQQHQDPDRIVPVKKPPLTAQQPSQRMLFSQGPLPPYQGSLSCFRLSTVERLKSPLLQPYETVDSNSDYFQPAPVQPPWMFYTPGPPPPYPSLFPHLANICSDGQRYCSANATFLTGQTFDISLLTVIIY